MLVEYPLPHWSIADHSRVVWGLDTYLNINTAADEWEIEFRLDF